MTEQVPDLRLTVIRDHAREQMLLRRISETEVRDVLENPESVIPVRPGRVVTQKVIELGTPAKVYLLRAFVDIDRNPPELVTVYRTSQIRKYGSRP